MKFLVVLFALFACTFAQNGRTKCTFFGDKLSLSCKGSSGQTVECQAIANFPSKFKMVGLGLDASSQMVRLHPLKLDNTAWLGNSFVQDGQQVTLTLSTSAPMGIRVREQSCFNNLMTLFRSSQANLVVPSEVNGVRGKLSLVGEVFLFDKSMTGARNLGRARF